MQRERSTSHPNSAYFQMFTVVLHETIALAPIQYSFQATSCMQQLVTPDASPYAQEDAYNVAWMSIKTWLKMRTCLL